MIHRGIFDLFLSLKTWESSMRVNTATVKPMHPIEAMFICAIMPIPNQMLKGRKRITHTMAYLYHMMIL